MRQPVEPADRQRAWEEAERTGQVELLLELRELEQAIGALPSDPEGLRRGQLLAWDRISTTWEAWDTQTGRRQLQRLLHPVWRADPVVLRVFERATRHAPGRRPDPFTLSLDAPGLPLSELLPVEDPLSARALTALLGGCLATLARLEAHGQAHGGPFTVAVHLQSDGPILHFLGTRVPAPAPREDLRELARLITLLDPLGLDPLDGLARAWVQDPPDNARDASGLFVARLAQELASARHGLVLAARGASRRARANALLRATRGLGRLPPPPLPRTVLAHRPDGGTVELESDGLALRAGLGSGEDLGIVWRADRGLDAPAARALLRAWSTAGAPGTAEPLMRWLAAAASLRRARLLLEHQARGPTARR